MEVSLIALEAPFECQEICMKFTNSFVNPRGVEKTALSQETYKAQKGLKFKTLV